MIEINMGVLKRLSSTDVKHAASEIYKETTSKDWAKTLDRLNKERSQSKLSEQIAKSEEKKAIREQINSAKSLAVLLPALAKDRCEDASTINALMEDSSFLISNKIIKEGELLHSIKESLDIKGIAENIHNQCKECAPLIFKRDMHELNLFIKDNQQKAGIDFILGKQKEHGYLAQYLDKESKDELDCMNYNLALKEIIAGQTNCSPKLEKQFVAGIGDLYRFARNEAMTILKESKEMSLSDTARVVQDANISHVLQHLKNKSNIAGLDQDLNGQEYIEAVAKDKTIMKYVDAAIDAGKDLDNSSNKKEDNTLLNYTNQRDIDIIREDLKEGTRERERFEYSVDLIQQIGSPEDLRDGLVIYNNEGIAALSSHSAKMDLETLSLMDMFSQSKQPDTSKDDMQKEKEVGSDFER